MNRKSILKLAALIAISIAAAGTIKSQTPGSLHALDANGQPAGDCPLKHTDVKAEVSGFISRVTVTQNFENSFPQKIEAVYTFPLPPAAAVDDLTMVIGDRTIKGTILRRADAAAAYTNAKKLGKIASLLDQQRPNVFTQQVANILPGQQIRVTISYVEMLKYADGSYEWSFPMVVAPRYNPAGNASDAVEPPRMPEGMRAGHDLSLEIDLDAGLPIVAVNSASHEIEVQQVDEKRALVKLKDQATIPNKDFVLTYGVAGDSINDAVLAHHNDRGGFFTLILQPPQRVQAEDVMPKEMVFVLDTSGSMEGFPLKTAKQTMLLALDTLYPHDTFNLITFSGDTEILFPEPVPATPENLRKAKKFLASRKSDGGTEMMKAVKAALDPSDSQYHVRLACFMTDGQVGNDAEILAEVQKHRNARVFAMGFGDAPNRSLLDKMTQYGRGEVDYVGQTGNMSAVARRFNDRVRNPLLTDISVEWSDLSITEVYPKHIPDLFGVRPVILSGRYTTGGKGLIRLKGKMAGQDFVREIPVELPEVENNHDTLSTLWARNKIEDLMSEVVSATDEVADNQRQEEITQLGLDFKLLTQYTSFVAIDEVMFTGTDDPVRVGVRVEALPGSIARDVSELVTVSCGSSLLSYGGSLSSSIHVRSIQDLPIQGRSIAGLLTLMPSNGPVSTTSRNFNFVVDGVSANSGIAPGGESPGTSASGNAPALTAAGGANGMVSLDAGQEVVIRTAPTDSEHDGATTQVEVTTQSGTNSFHGSAFHFFGNDALDANDWFANARGLQQPPKRLNIFGGTLEGPIQRNRLFFFASYEGMRLSQPLTGITDVPSISARQTAPDALRPFLSAFPVPNSTARSDGFSEFAESFANPARHDAGSLRLQHMLSTSINLRGRYTFADSDASQRGANGFSLNTTHRIRTRAQTVTGMWIQTVSPRIVFEVHGNYSRFRTDGSYLLDEFGEAATPALMTQAFAFDLNSRNAGFMIGDAARNVQRQFNLVGSTFMVYGNHNLKFGADYRRLSPIIGLRPFEQNVLFDGLAQALTGTAARVNGLTLNETQTPLFNTLSLYAQDQWRQSHRFTLTYGLRWELAPAPSIDGALAVDQVVDPTALTLAVPGTPLWRTTFADFAPRAAFAYQLTNPDGPLFVLRGGVGILYDLGQNRSADIFANSIPFVSGFSVFNSPYPQSVTTTQRLPLMAFDPQLKLPYAINWNVTLERALDGPSVVSVAYVGSSGQRLLQTQTLFDQNPAFPFLRLTTNRGTSDWRALQFVFDRSYRNGLEARVSYTWSHSTDNLIRDSERNIIMTSLNPQLDRGPSDFDIRHHLTGLLTYSLPAPFSQGLGYTLLRKWTIDSIFNARSAKPLNVLYWFPTSIGVAYFRPDVVSGAPLYVLDPAVAGGRRINQAAFVIPAALQEGTSGRNSLRGFPLYQIDLGLRRRFNFTDDFSLQIQADAFNLFNTANFEDPLANDLIIGGRIRPNLAFGESTSLSGRSLGSGGFASFYGPGGARTLRFSVKLIF